MANVIQPSQAMASDKHLSIIVEFTGGLELLFGNVRKYGIKIPPTDGDGKPSNIKYLIHHLCDSYMKDRRRDMFVLNDTVRPGILVLINEADWELEGEDQYEIQDGDSILFVSTLHGG